MANVIPSDMVFNHVPAPMAHTVFHWDPSLFGFQYLRSSCKNLTVTLRPFHYCLCVCWDLSALCLFFHFSLQFSCTAAVKCAPCCVCLEMQPMYECFSWYGDGASTLLDKFHACDISWQYSTLQQRVRINEETKCN